MARTGRIPVLSMATARRPKLISDVLGATSGPWRRRISRVVSKTEYKDVRASRSLPSSGPNGTTVMRVVNSR